MNRPYQNIWGSVTIHPSTRLGAYVEIGGTEDDPTIIGEDTVIQAFCFICPGTTIGKNVFLGPRVTILNDMFPPSDHTFWAPVTIEDEASIGGSVTILPGVTIGKGARIGAGSVVTRNVPPGEVWAGNPATPDFRIPVLREVSLISGE